MMEFWSENQRQSQVYSRFGTVPGRNCAHNYHNRHQISHYPLNFGEEQDRERESSDWTLHGSRAALNEYTNWTDPSSSSFHFPVVLDPRRHQDAGYRQHEAGDREWTTSQRAARDHERGFLREAWQRRWEPSNSLSYERELSARRNNGNYRELEAWAARYSHSLPRRRRVEAELQETNQGLVDPQMQHVQINPNKISGLWDRGQRLRAPTYNTSFTKENTTYQRRVFSRPPGYVAPPSYKNPHQTSPVKPSCNTSIEQLGQTQTYWSRNSADFEDQKTEKEQFRNSDESKACSEHTRQEEDALLAAGPIKTQKSSKMDGMLALQHPQSAQSSTSKVIEGRKFRLNKKTGGMTIFCLVSRIANASETSSSPIYTSQTNIQSTDQEEVSTDLKNRREISQLADEVDFKALTSTEQLRQNVRSLTVTQTRNEMLEDDLTNKAEAKVSLERVADNENTFVSHSVQPASVKYPLWRKPTSTTSTPQKNLDEESDNVHAAGNVSDHSTNEETSKTDTEDRKGQMVIDTSCVVVKVEMIPSPKKEHVHYSVNTETNNQTFVSCKLNDRLDQNTPGDENQDATHSQTNTSQETDASFSRAKPETLEKRAKRILGISLQDSAIEERPDEASGFESYVKEQNKEAEPSPSEQTPEDTVEEGEVVQNQRPEYLKDSEDIRNPVANEASEGCTESQQKFTDLSEDKNPDNKTSAETETTNIHLETTSEKNQRQVNNEATQLPDLGNSACELLTLNTSEEAPPPNTSQFLLPKPSSSPPPETADFSSNFPPCTDSLPSPPPLEEIVLIADEASGAEHKDEEDETSHLPESRVKGQSTASDTKDEKSEQQAGRHQPDDATSEEQQTEEADEEPENCSKETVQTSKADERVDVDILCRRLEHAQTEGAARLEESNWIEQQLLQETNKDPDDAEVQTHGTEKKEEEREENAINDPIDVNMFQQSDVFQEEKAFCGQDTSEAKNELQTSPGLSQQSATDTQINEDILQHFDSSCFLTSVAPPPLEPDTDFVPSLEMDSISSSPPNFDAAALEVDSPFSLDSCEESNQFSSSLSTSPPVLPLSAPPPPEDNAPPHVSPSAARKQKAPYPKTLRDVVNRIRKHTAPDSESEEEDLTEPWDPESVSCPDVAEEVKSEETLFEEAEKREVLKEIEIGRVKQDDEETLSCSSSSSSLVSEDTVIVTEEEMRVTTKMEEKNEEFDKTEGEMCCSGEDEAPLEEEAAELNKSECAVEVMETDFS